MDKILGADQEEYGPVTAEQVRAWIAQRRAVSETRVQAEGSTDWNPVSAFPEFAAALATPSARPATIVVTDDPVSKVVPYRNPQALIAYYLAIFSLIPCVGLLLGAVAFVLGLLGLK